MIECRGYLLDETPAAYFISESPRNRPGHGSFGEWFPRSQIPWNLKQTVPEGTKIEFKIKAWFLQKKQAWRFAK